MLVLYVNLFGTEHSTTLHFVPELTVCLIRCCFMKTCYGSPGQLMSQRVSYWVSYKLDFLIGVQLFRKLFVQFVS